MGQLPPPLNPGNVTRPERPGGTDSVPAIAAHGRGWVGGWGLSPNGPSIVRLKFDERIP